MTVRTHSRRGHWLVLAALIVTLAVYWPGLSGGWLFDDYPNIVDNHGVQPPNASIPSLVRAALSSPASEFKRPLASLSFAANYLISGLSPYGWKLTNLLIHLVNGWLVFLLASALLRIGAPLDGDEQRDSPREQPHSAWNEAVAVEQARESETVSPVGVRLPSPLCAKGERKSIVAALIAAGWMLLPINLTGVLYVVQRMESMANVFVLLGLLGYVCGRRRMLAATATVNLPFPVRRARARWYRGYFRPHPGFALCLISLIAPTALGVLAKETAVMLPLYALLIEWMVFRFCTSQGTLESSITSSKSCFAKAEKRPSRDRRIIMLFLMVLALPMVLGLAWLLPGIFKPEAWATRDFTLGTRLLSEARIVVDYIAWTLIPTPGALSFYHDDFRLSTGLLIPWTTLTSIVFLAALVALMLWLRSRRPLAALGIALFLGCQLLTGTILPLELVYEHRNYFASFGLLLAIVPLLAAPRTLPLALPRYALLTGLMLCWTVLTALTAYAWGDPLRLAEDLADRAPQSPRAEYELGRTYIIYSHYDPTSPFTKLAYAPLEKAATLPDSSILPEQALIFMNARMQLPLQEAWWNSLITKLKAHKPGVQDESSLSALTQCVREDRCDLPQSRMIAAFMAALSHPNPSARLLATYGDYAWNVLQDRSLGERMTEQAVKVSPDEPAYQITLIRMLVAQGRQMEADKALERLGSLNMGGRLNNALNELRTQLSHSPAPIRSSGIQ